MPQGLEFSQTLFYIAPPGISTKLYCFSLRVAGFGLGIGFYAMSFFTLTGPAEITEFLLFFYVHY